MYADIYHPFSFTLICCKHPRYAGPSRMETGRVIFSPLESGGKGHQTLDDMFAIRPLPLHNTCEVYTYCRVPLRSTSAEKQTETTYLCQAVYLRCMYPLQHEHGTALGHMKRSDWIVVVRLYAVPTRRLSPMLECKS